MDIRTPSPSSRPCLGSGEGERPSAFINGIYDPKRTVFLEAMAFGASSCDMRPELALASPSHGVPRLKQLSNAMQKSRLILHEMTPFRDEHGNCRLNPAFELSMAMHLGRGPHSLIFAASASELYACLSNAQGLDIEEHRNDPALLVRKLVTAVAINPPAGQYWVPNVDRAYEEYKKFRKPFEQHCKKIGLRSDDNLALRVRLIDKLCSDII